MPAIQPLSDANVRSQTYYVATTNVRCWHCGAPTRLMALALPHHHETLDTDTQAVAGDRDAPAPDTWQRASVNAFLFYVEQLSDGVLGHLSQFSQHFRLAHSAVTLNSYWANHCEHCGTLLEDHELHCEPPGAFMPCSEAAAMNVHLQQIPEPFEAAAAGYAFDPEFFRFMRRS
jgi:hypothetical protein